jgi:ABC-type glycerol-3-phosphate transport system permease component
MSVSAMQSFRQLRNMSFGMYIVMLLLIFGLLVTLAPIAYMFSQALTPESQTMQWPIKWIPEQPTLANFDRFPLADQQFGSGDSRYGAGALHLFAHRLCLCSA